MSSNKELFNVYNEWNRLAKERVTNIGLPTPIELARYVNYPDLDEDPNLPALNTWRNVLRALREQFEAGNLPSLSTLSSEYFIPEGPQRSSSRTSETLLDSSEKLEEKGQEQHASATKDSKKNRRSGNVAAQTSYSEFAALDEWALDENAPLKDGGLKVAGSEEGISLSWEAPAQAKFEIFRIYSRDDEYPSLPSEDNCFHITSEAETVDLRSLNRGARFYEVWVNSGNTRVETLKAQPKILAREVYISPVKISEPTYDGSSISAQWVYLEGTKNIEVFATKDEEPAEVGTPFNRICKDEENLKGFNYRPDERGVTYRIAARRQVEVGGHILSSELSDIRFIKVKAELEDFPCEINSEDDKHIQVTWKAPSSLQVLVYRTPRQPDANLVGLPYVDKQRLADFGLPSDAQDNLNREQEESHVVIWPEDWNNLFITIVGVVGGQARVIKTKSFVRVGSVKNARYHERVEEQLISFGWPSDASHVRAYVGPLSGEHETREGIAHGMTAESEVTLSSYEKQGGMILQLHRPEIYSEPQSIALFPVRYHQRQEVVGEPTVIEYPGLNILRYEFSLSEQVGAIDLQCFELGLTAHQPIERALSFTLIRNDHHLPLERGDGQMIELVDKETGQKDKLARVNFSRNLSNRSWLIDPADLRGFEPGTSFLRLFIWEDESIEIPTALIDPSPQQLSLEVWYPANPPQKPQPYAQLVSNGPTFAETQYAAPNVDYNVPNYAQGEIPPVETTRPAKKGFLNRIFGK